MVTKPINGKPATTPNVGTIGFLMSDAKQADAWHNAYLRDPDGHKLVGVAR
jgi:hypothetical protein